MTTLTDTNGSVFAYEFDGEGNRLSQSLNDCLSKRFVYDGADILRLLCIDGESRARRVFKPGALGSIAPLGRTPTSEAMSWPLAPLRGGRASSSGRPGAKKKGA